MVRQFWNELLTQESWRMLTKLAKKYDFILIGGWAIYLWTKTHKSKDIDIVIDYAVLKELGADFALEKNQRLCKYEIKQAKFDIDIYLPYFSKLALPVGELAQYSAMVEGIKTVRPEALLILKQAAEIDRRGSLKGRKDAIDLLTLLIHAPFDLALYRKMLVNYGLFAYEKELKQTVLNFSDKDRDYLGIGFLEFNRWKKKFIAQLEGK